jgi:hypothetical protein
VSRGETNGLDTCERWSQLSPFVDPPIKRPKSNIQWLCWQRRVLDALRIQCNAIGGVSTQQPGTMVKYAINFEKKRTLLLFQVPRPTCRSMLCSRSSSAVTSRVSAPDSKSNGGGGTPTPVMFARPCAALVRRLSTPLAATLSRLSLIPTVNGNTVRSFPTTDNCRSAAQGSSTRSHALTSD